MTLVCTLVGAAVLLCAAWYVLGFAINSTLYCIVLRTPPWRRARGATPDWLYSLYYFTIGPVGWAFWFYDRWR